MRLTIVQYGGDYREAFERFAQGGKETFYAQRYSVNSVEALARSLDQVAVICALGSEPYDTILSNGVRAIGAGLKPGFHPSELIPVLSRTQPTRLSLQTPLVPVLKWAKANRLRTIVPLADSFQGSGLRQKFWQRRLAHYLNQAFVEWVGNHGINACLSLLDIGVTASKVIPWDWPPSHRPADYAARTFTGKTPAKLLYVGSVTHAKGVGDLLMAVAHLRQQGVMVLLSIIGRDPDGTMIKLAQNLNLDGDVEFVGIVPNNEVPAAMRAADIVIIPSRHEYPEGLPNTIYEALSARTPIIASDHPMFRGALMDGDSALIFPCGKSNALAAAIIRLLRDPDLYAVLSARSEAAWNRLQLPVHRPKLIEAWLADDPVQTKWIRDHRLISGIYDERVRERRQAMKGTPQR
jgi:glycosyltransferase involved in cell wall biosynthesis